MCDTENLKSQKADKSINFRGFWASIKSKSNYFTPFAMKGNIQGTVVSVRDTSNDNRPSGSSTDDEIVRTNALSTGANPTYCI